MSNPYLAGNFAPVTEEVTIADLAFDATTAAAMAERPEAIAQ